MPTNIGFTPAAKVYIHMGKVKQKGDSKETGDKKEKLKNEWETEDFLMAQKRIHKAAQSLEA